MASDSLQEKMPTHGRRVHSHRGAIGVLPRGDASAIAQHCDGSSAAAKLPGGGTAAIVRCCPRGIYKGPHTCIPNAQ